MKKKAVDKSGPARMLAVELVSLRREMRATVNAYTERLEKALAASANKIASYDDVEKFSRDRLSEIRDLTIMLRKRKLKPEKGRRKDLRKIDMLVDEVYAATHAAPRNK